MWYYFLLKSCDNVDQTRHVIYDVTISNIAIGQRATFDIPFAIHEGDLNLEKVIWVSEWVSECASVIILFYYPCYIFCRKNKHALEKSGVNSATSLKHLATEIHVASLGHIITNNPVVYILLLYCLCFEDCNKCKFYLHLLYWGIQHIQYYTTVKVKIYLSCLTFLHIQ